MTWKNKSKRWGLACLFLPLALQGQVLPEKIMVSHRYITVLVFDSPVCGVELASDDYVAKLRGHYLMLRCRKPGALPTSLFVTYNEGQAFLHTLLCFAPEPPKTYDLRSYQRPREATEEQEEEAAAASMASSLQGMRHMAGLAQVHKDIGLRQERMTLILMNVMADQAYTYLKFFIANNSCIDYDIEEVSFCFQSGAKKSIPVTPVLTTQKRWIAAYHQEELIYVLPSYGVKERGTLLLELREARGERVLQLAIPASILVKAPRYHA